MHVRLRLFYLPFFLLLVSGLAQAQTQPAAGAKPSSVPAPASTAPDYTSESIVYERLATVVRFHADGTAEATMSGRVRVQSEAGLRQVGVLHFPYASGTERMEILLVRVHKKDGSVVETPASEAQDLPEP